MKVFLSYRDYLRNFEGYLREFDPNNKNKLVIETHDKWLNVQPAVVTIVSEYMQET